MDDEVRVRARIGVGGADGSEPTVAEGVVGVDGNEKRLDKLEADSANGDGGVGSSTPSRSPSITTLSSSVDGKKLRKSSSACHLEAFLNSTQTSMRPGRDSAGSRRSR